MSTKELAKWANKTPKYITDNKKNWCEKVLSKYAKYEIVRGGVNILSIIEPYFYTSGKREVEEKYLNYWGYDGYYIDQNNKCWAKLKPHMKNEISDRTGQNYVSQARIKDFGQASKKKEKGGIRGECRYVCFKIVDGKMLPFTEEELKIRAKVWKETFAYSDIERAFEQRALTEAFKRGEISMEEYSETMVWLNDTDKDWYAFQARFESLIGYKIDFGILLEERAWLDYDSASVKR